MIDLSVNKESLKHNIENARKNNVILPTYEEMKDPGKIPAKIQEKLDRRDGRKVVPDRLP